MIKRYTFIEDDIVSIYNDGMLRVFTQLDTYSEKGNFEGWVRKIVLNSLSNYFRKNDQKIKMFEIKDYDHKTSSYILDNLYYNDLLKLMKILPERSSEIFRMYVLDGYTHKEISVKLGISEGTSKWHVFKAREKLAAKIELNQKSYE